MKLLIAAYWLLALVSAGCLNNLGRHDFQGSPVSFRKTMKSQDAVFYLPVGWCGGLGTPICDAHHQPLLLNGQPVFFTGDIAEIAKRAKESQNPVDSAQGLILPPSYLVRARIHVEKCRGTNRSLPPNHWREQDYYGLVIEEILDVQAKVEQ
jgi:hypothetical protein